MFTVGKHTTQKRKQKLEKFKKQLHISTDIQEDVNMIPASLRN